MRPPDGGFDAGRLAAVPLFGRRLIPAAADSLGVSLKGFVIAFSSQHSALSFQPFSRRVTVSCRPTGLQALLCAAQIRLFSRPSKENSALVWQALRCQASPR